MEPSPRPSLARRLRTAILGGARSPSERGVFHKISLIAFFAWVGLGVDGLSSSCYGPQEAFGVLHGHMVLGLFVAAATALTVFVISTSYSQIVELFPTGGGGYLVASKLLSPSLGMVSGCALLIDYVLTVAVSVSSGADALFSFLPDVWQPYRIHFALAGVAVLTVVNLRGVKESVLPLIPIFLVFVVTHVAVIVYAVAVKAGDLGQVARTAGDQLSRSSAELGVFGMLLLTLKAYSMGAGTYTGIEAVSNGLPILREPRVQTARRTMRYMAFSLAFTAGGLMVAYYLHGVSSTGRPTANALLLRELTGPWGGTGQVFILVTLISEAVILFTAAQTGFLGGPRVLSNMAADRWMPSKFSVLSDRLVTAHGIVMMGAAALVIILMTGARVGILVVLYSINVFLTFSLSQLGMVRHWWRERKGASHWVRGLGINGLGLLLTVLILVSVTIVKFHDGGWVTLIITGALVTVAVLIRRHYNRTHGLLKRLDGLVRLAEIEPVVAATPAGGLRSDARTAVLLVNGFNGLGLHSLLAVVRLFGKSFEQYAFVQVGVVDAGNFKGAAEVEQLRRHVESEVQRYVNYMRGLGFPADGFASLGVDVVEEAAKVSEQIRQRCPDLVFFGGQVVFGRDTYWSRVLHNYIVFAVQRRLYTEGVPFVILPVRL